MQSPPDLGGTSVPDPAASGIALVPGLGGPRGARVRSAPTENATLVAREAVSPTIARLVVLPDAPIATFEPGQYLALGLRVGDRFVRRPYSTASPPGAAAHELLVRLVPAGALTPSLWEVPAGTRVQLGPPRGTFTLRPDDRRPHLFVASGTGLAPFVAMIRALAEQPRPPRVILVHGVARAGDLAFREELAGLARVGLPFAYEPTVSRAGDPSSRGWIGRTGRAEQALPAILEEHDVHAPGAVAYLCGNPGMVEAARIVLAGAGMEAADIHGEEFWGPGATAAA
jgi:ferredoxin-NADP reductase